MFACCDESGLHAGSRWWAFGVLWLPADGRLPLFERDVAALRQKTNCWGEFKWAKLMADYCQTYLDFLDIALSLPDLRFTSMVVDTKQLGQNEMTKFHKEEGRNEAYLKFMRLLIQKRLPVMTDLGNRDFTLLYDKLPVKAAGKKAFREILLNDMRNHRQASGAECRYVHLSQGKVTSVEVV